MFGASQLHKDARCLWGIRRRPTGSTGRGGSGGGGVNVGFPSSAVMFGLCDCGQAGGRTPPVTRLRGKQQVSDCFPDQNQRDTDTLRLQSAWKHVRILRLCVRGCSFSQRALSSHFPSFLLLSASSFPPSLSSSLRPFSWRPEPSACNQPGSAFGRRTGPRVVLSGRLRAPVAERN